VGLECESCTQEKGGGEVERRGKRQQKCRARKPSACNLVPPLSCSRLPCAVYAARVAWACLIGSWDKVFGEDPRV